MKVRNYAELQEALFAEDGTIELIDSINAPAGIRLRKGQRLTAGRDGVMLSFINGGGIALSGDNEVSGLAVQTSPASRAVYIDSAEEDLGLIRLKGLTVTGMVQLLTRGANKKLSADLRDLDIVSADARACSERPMKYGVIVYQGALTVYNFSPDKDSLIRLRAENISVGREKAPVIGSGVFVAGFGDEGGRVVVEKLTTGEVYSNGMIPQGQPNLITGGIFIVNGAHAREVISEGRVVTYGTNDMVLDVWGSVDSWLVKGEVTSYGASGIGFVNFGTVGRFRAEKSIETYGLGARGFNQYDGTIEDGYFERILTWGDGSVGMQFSKPVGRITIGKEIVTRGGTGKTLVKGVIVELAADAVSVLSGGSIEELDVRGDIVTAGAGVTAYHVNGGLVKKMRLGGSIRSTGAGARAAVIENGGQSDTESLGKYLA